ncbi:helix-turn-helix domain-containing protein [Novosphingobium huizhouense]|uniref:helix-turn-helix domain-containing protein n=1 Tax=Novosphingobium huizhouense TaxID=2866625 RepID=UPI001CD8620E|nr:helix-turn-helix domain-containing protein [Novosphingobium huizhouense]
MSGAAPVLMGCDFASRPDQTAIHIEGDLPSWDFSSVAIRIAAALYSVDVRELLSRRRGAALENARALVAWCHRAIPEKPFSYPEIGRAMDGRDHTTAMALHARAVRLRMSDGFFLSCCSALQRFHARSEGFSHADC